MTDLPDRYPNYPPYDNQVTFYQGSTLRVPVAPIPRQTRLARWSRQKCAQNASSPSRSGSVYAHVATTSVINVTCTTSKSVRTAARLPVRSCTWGTRMYSTPVMASASRCSTVRKCWRNIWASMGRFGEPLLVGVGDLYGIFCGQWK